MGNHQIPKTQQNPYLHQHDQQQTFTCDICIKPVTLIDKFINNAKCAHPFCTNCMIKYIQVKLENNVSNIKCPATTCHHVLEPLSCRHIITRTLFNKWCDVLCESKVLEVDRVYCPNRECLELILNECGVRNLTRCVCPRCKKPFCFKCKVPWHDGSICEGNKDENEAAFDALCSTNNWKTCPKCGHCVEHVGGCNIIHCRCGCFFCYKCRKETRHMCVTHGKQVLEANMFMIVSLLSVAISMLGLIYGW